VIFTIADFLGNQDSLPTTTRALSLLGALDHMEGSEAAEVRRSSWFPVLRALALRTQAEHDDSSRRADIAKRMRVLVGPTVDMKKVSSSTRATAASRLADAWLLELDYDRAAIDIDHAMQEEGLEGQESPRFFIQLARADVVEADKTISTAPASDVDTNYLRALVALLTRQDGYDAGARGGNLGAI
jgi:hypothetical protein